MRYLIIKTSSFGDVVQAFSVASALKEISPHAEIDWVCEKNIAPLVVAHPDVSEVLTLEAKKWKKKPWQIQSWLELFDFLSRLRKKEYDAVFDLQGNTKSGLLTFFARSKNKIGFGWKSAPERINCLFTTSRANPPKGQNIRRDYLFLLQHYFKRFDLVPNDHVTLKLSDEEKEFVACFKQQIKQNYWIICPGSAWKNKCLSEAQLEIFLKKAYEMFHPQFVFLCGSEKERKLALSLQKKFQLSLVLDTPPLASLQHLMNEAELVISVDSLPLHLAGCVKTATFSIFGPSTSFKYRPMGEHHFSYQGSCPFNKTFEKRCPILRSCKSAKCMSDILPDALFLSFANWWKQIIRMN